MPNTKLELAYKYFTAPQVRERLRLSRFQLDLRIRKGILPVPTFTDPDTQIRYFDQDWLRKAQALLSNSIKENSIKEDERR